MHQGSDRTRVNFNARLACARVKKKAITMRTGYDLSAVNVLRTRARASIARNTQHTFPRICRMIRFDSVTGAVGTISLT